MKKKEQENQTDSGEFVPTFFSWHTLAGQKKRAKELSEITKRNGKKSK